MANTTTTICTYLFAASDCPAVILLVLTLDTRVPFSTAEYLGMQWCGDKCVGCGASLVLTFAPFSLLGDPFVVDQCHGKFTAEVVDIGNLGNLHRLPDKVTERKPAFHFRDGKQETEDEGGPVMSSPGLLDLQMTVLMIVVIVDDVPVHEVVGKQLLVQKIRNFFAIDVPYIFFIFVTLNN